MLASRIGARAGPSVRQITSLRAQTHTCSPSVALAQKNSSLRMYTSESSQNTPKRTALYDLHVENGATFATFAGWQMPMKFGDLTALESHHHTRRNASIFDVSHMLQLSFTGPNRTEFLERIVCGDIAGLPSGGGTLSLMTNSEGGIIDDCVVVNADDHVYMVANAGCADKDLVHIKSELSAFADGEVEMEVMDTYSLIALQGPKAMDVLAKHVDDDEVMLKDLPFMASVNDVSVHGVPGCRITRCGYTGEDGFEISMPSYKAVCITRALLSEDEAANAGLAARDSLRLEAGLCLYGSDIDATTSPMEANLGWTVAKRRRTESGFVGGDIIVDQLKKKVCESSGVRRRVGLVVDGAPARAHSKVLDMEGNEIGEITSGVPYECTARFTAV
ncbi:glycine cleavage system T protein [Sphaeroforma arctica JP610]|uniref:Aminomethyltransferase n=1 Tax=Sphaeroforma arctica JP610 TaxID=667725 RepID=A0A0L0G8C7_9EUKA|nr:glycine cleavage system T protein [Sphaeroforma arctica JP610]KNC85159.1 glycine cleavage system T protein [Sphaeroforma arctica JP610]|eukprot:XP_014159061.1 glycine cleavage system T protein [Sphaeroforma arctica JP610]